MPTAIMPEGRQRYFNNDGTPAAGGKLWTYAAGTTALKATYADEAGTTPNPNPIPLDAKGEAVIYWDGAYKVDLRQADGVAVTGYPVDNIKTDPGGLFAKFAQLAASAGAAMVGFILNAAGAIARTVLDRLLERVSVLDFMTDAQRASVRARDYAVDVTAAVQAALDYAGNLSGGVRVYAPRGGYFVTNTLNIKANTYFYGDGWFASMFKCGHAGDFLKSTFPINSSSAANINVKDLGAFASVASNGGGYVDVGGTYINVENCFFQAFKYPIILDQSELVVVDRNYLLGWVSAGLWIVNGPDHTPGANKGFTNRITITNNQFNGTGGHCIRDDGGGNHLISGNNFNQGGTQIFVAGCGSLTITNNEFEGASAYPIFMSETTSAGAYVGPCAGFGIRDNGIGGGVVSVFMQAAHGGDISGNVVYGYSTCAFEADYGPNWRVTNVNIGGNYKSLLAGSGRTDKPFFSDPSHKANFASAGRVDQLGHTYSNQAPAAGVFVTTPLSMEDITEGCLLRVMNADGTNPETVQAYNVAPTTFTAQYASAKTAGFLIFVLREQNAGTFTPTPSGSAAAGVWTTSACKLVWEKKDGRVHFNLQITWSAMTGAGQMTVAMPFKAKNNGVINAWPVTLTGPGAIGAGVGPVTLALSGGTSQATMVYLNTATGNFSAFQCPASGDMYVCGSYETL